MLDDLLGRVAFVRILRVLSRASHPLSQGEIARRAGLDASGVSRALGTLEELGIVRRRKSGQQYQVTLDGEHPLADSLAQLYDAERRRAESFLDRLRSELEEHAPPLQAAWLQGPLAAGEDRPGTPAALGVLAPARDVDELVDVLQRAADRIGGDLGLLVDVYGYTRADLEAAPADAPFTEAAEPLYGPDPASLVSDIEGSAAGVRTHQDLDAISRRRAERVADYLRNHPEAREEALEWVEKRLDEEASDRVTLQEWLNLLTHQSVSRICDLLIADTARARRLRQSNPFTAVLPDEALER